MKITNHAGLSLPVAVWLATEGYDFSPGARRAISATSLLKSTRQILLSERLTEADKDSPDLLDFIPSRLGHTIHDGIERAWTQNYAKALTLLGYPQSMIDRIVVNPKQARKDDQIPVYLERRTEREFMGYMISGKFDLVLDGELHDFKTTSTFTWTSGNKDEDYRLQGSIYRWLNPGLITSDWVTIQFVFKDHQKYMANGKDYPAHPLMEKRLPLLSIQDTEAWLKAKFRELEKHAELDEAELPHCTDKQLWRSDPVWKYYSDPANAHDPSKRATKNFDSAAEAHSFQKSKGKGIVIEVPGQVKACGYCPVFNICSQKDEYQHA